VNKSAEQESMTDYYVKKVSWAIRKEFDPLGAKMPIRNKISKIDVDTSHLAGKTLVKDANAHATVSCYSYGFLHISPNKSYFSLNIH